MDVQYESASMLRSMQYTIARAILRVKANPAITATIGELGWLPFNIILDKHSVKYFYRLKHVLEPSRLCKKVFLEMEQQYLQRKRSVWPYIDVMYKTLTNVGLDSAKEKYITDLPYVYDRLRLSLYEQEFHNEINTRSTLSLYKYLKSSTTKEKYLFNMEYFDGARLKFKARTGCLGLQTDLKRWGLADNDVCTLCGNDKEDVQHFLFTCSKLNSLRIKYFYELESKLFDSGNFHIWSHFCTSSVFIKSCILLGSVDIHLEECATDPIDAVCKSYLLEAWRLRKSLRDGEFSDTGQNN